MLKQLDVIALQLGITTGTLLIAGVGLGMLILLWGVWSAVAGDNPAVVRLAAMSRQRRDRVEGGLLLDPSEDPRGFMKGFIPTDLNERTELSRKLAQAGVTSKHALRNYTLIRVVLGFGLPMLFLGLAYVSRIPGINMPLGLTDRLARLNNLTMFQILGVLIAVGYFAPTLWLRSRVEERQLKIIEAFPNALDLMQISVEAGMGFDAAMTRVGNELSQVSPELSREFLGVQLQIQAGRPREVALHDMALRTGVEMVRSFANVVIQSLQFGTSMAEALTTYAVEMRAYRELKAQEMANKLPVKMSAVLAMLMLPAIVLITIGPVVIRYMRNMGG